MIPPRIEIPIGCLPARTELGLEVTFNGDGSRTIQSLFTCVDCGFKTTTAAEMNDHQENQAKRHTLWQRLRRRWRCFWRIR